MNTIREILGEEVQAVPPVDAGAQVAQFIYRTLRSEGRITLHEPLPGDFWFAVGVAFGELLIMRAGEGYSVDEQQFLAGVRMYLGDLDS